MGWIIKKMLEESMQVKALVYKCNTTLATTTTNVKDLQGILNHDLREITKWSKRWLVPFNPAKSKIKHLFFFNSIMIFLTSTDTHKHLGVTLSHDCKWHTHINTIYQHCPHRDFLIS